MSLKTPFFELLPRYFCRKL